MAKSSILKKGDRQGAAIFNGSTWYHRYKILLPSGDIKYGKEQGFNTPEEANESSRKYEEEFENAARKQGLATRLDGKIMFIDYLKYYLEDVLGPRCEPSTKIVYSYVLYRYVIPTVKRDIEIGLVDKDFLDDILVSVGPMTKSASNKTREFFYLALKQALLEKRISNIPSMRKCPRPKPQIKVLKKEQLKVLLSAAADSNWYLEILLALFMGLRKGEILGLKFDDFDLDKNSVHVVRQLAPAKKVEPGTCKKLSSKKVEKKPKSENSDRVIYAPQVVIDELKLRKECVDRDKLMNHDYHDEGYVCCQKNGDSRGFSSMNTELTKLCKRNGLPHATVHSLRHCYATILLEQGYALQMVSAMLGHASINTTFEFYAEIMDESEDIKVYLNELYPVAEEE